MSRRQGAIVALLATLIAIATWTGRAWAVSPCGGESDMGACGVANPCGCCAKPGENWPNGTCGNCVWHAWHAACDGWNVAVPWACSDGHQWNDLAIQAGYAVDGVAQPSSIFVCEASSVWSTWGHVGWIVSVNADGSSNTTEQFCSSTNCGTFSKVRPSGFADAYIHHGGGTPVEVDGAKFVSETIPDGTKFAAGASFVKRWTMKNSGNTTWTSSAGYTWDYFEQEQFGAATQTALAASESVAPGDNYDWEVQMTAPSSPGTYRGYWRMNHAGKGMFGEKVWVEIVVGSGQTTDAGAKDTGAPDTGAVQDSGTKQDASTQPDTGADASVKDGAAKGGSAGAAPWDAGAQGSDSGSSPPLFNKRSEEDAGCGCRAVGAAPKSSLSGIGSVAVLLLIAASRLGKQRRTRARKSGVA